MRPLTKLMNAVEFGSTGAVLMSWFHQLLRGKICWPPSDPVSAGGKAAETIVRLAAQMAAAMSVVRTCTPGVVHLLCRR